MSRCPSGEFTGGRERTAPPQRSGLLGPLDRPTGLSRPPNREETHAIREWARQHGHQVSDRGRIPKSVIEAYQAAQ
ncbi:MAG TPA: histone-like nucleoid-structuring protein Lsr2 [Pseudonocardia sp.]|nr:histone-like nucleoid-structuring protein Lsr2 [Pseudonocardia sp.]